MEYRTEDIVLHSLTGIIAGLVIHIKNIWNKLKHTLRKFAFRS